LRRFGGGFKMVQTLNYNLHDIITFKIVRDKGYGLRDLINLKFSFFEDEDVDDPDITLNIGKFTPSNKNCYLVDYKYYVKKDYFYCKDSEGNAKWKVEITGFEDGHTIINFNGKMGGFPSIINSDFISQNLLLRIIEYKLAKKEYFLAHAAGISRDSKAYVLAGRGGTFKTSLCMDFIRKAGFDFLGDDHVILHKDMIFSFPMGLRVFGFMCGHLPNEESWNISNRIRFARYLWDNKDKKDNSIKMSDSSELKKLFFIVKTNKEKITERKIPLTDAIDRLIVNNRLEDFISLGGMGINSGPFLKYALAYSYIFPDNKMATYQEDLERELWSVLEKEQIHEIEIPYNYDINVFKRVYKFIESLE
jgi:hypothetical protein